MANPEVEIIWGGRSWSRNHRKVVRPIISAAADLACSAVEALGVEYKDPKRLSIWKCLRNWPDAGANYSSVDMDIYVRGDHIRHRKVARKIVSHCLTATHEITHAVRREKQPDQDDLIEHIASEGLAYVSEDLVSELLLTKEEIFYFGDCINIKQSISYDRLKSRLRPTELAEARGDTTIDDGLDGWMQFESDSLPPGIIIGITEVYRRLVEGNKFSNIIEWPADQILDLKLEA